MGDNPFNTVPEVVSSLTLLKELHMMDCKITNISERFVGHNISSVSESQSLTSLHVCQLLSKYIILHCYVQRPYKVF